MAKTGDTEDEFLKRIGMRLRQLRKQKGFTNYENFAFTHGINRVQYGRYENGSDIRISSLRKIVKAHGMTMAEFFKEGFD